MKKLEQEQPSIRRQNHEKDLIQFQVGYQFKSDKVGESIFGHITNDFILPAQIDRYLHKETESEMKDSIFQIIDYRVLKIGDSFELLTHDSNQFQQIKKTSLKNRINRTQGFYNLIQQTKNKMSRKVQRFSHFPSNFEKSQIQNKQQIKSQKQFIKQKYYQTLIEDFEKTLQKQFPNEMIVKGFKKEKKILEDAFYTFNTQIDYIDAWTKGIKSLSFIKSTFISNAHQQTINKTSLSAKKSLMEDLLTLKLKDKNSIKAILFKKTESFHKNDAYCLLLRFKENLQKETSKPSLFQSKKSNNTLQIEKIDEHCSQRDYIIDLSDQNIQKANIHLITVQFRAKTVQMSKQGFFQVDQHNHHGAKVKFIQFDVKGLHSFINTDQNKKKKLLKNKIKYLGLDIQPKSDRFYIQCEALDSKYDKNQISYFCDYFSFRKSKIFGEKHYNLAFQGGGAKGLAYVGAYKAIKQNRKSIKIKSIMGSSAGGMIAVAASTGITDRQIQRLCFKMGNISKEDVINKNDKQPALDQFGNEIIFQKVKNTLKRILVEFGFLNQSTFDELATTITQKITEIQEDLVQYLRIIYPSIANIFEFQEVTKVIKQQGLLWWKKSIQTEQKKRRINWDGILLHGALMKGDAIHDITAKCLSKYLIKESYKPGFQQRLMDLFTESLQDESKINHEKIKDLLKKHKKQQLNILTSSLQQYWFNYFSRSKDFDQFLISVANKGMNLLNQFLQEQKQSIELSKIHILHNFSYSQDFLHKIETLSLIIKEINYKKYKNIKENVNMVKEGYPKQIAQSILSQQNLIKTLKTLQKYIDNGQYCQRKQKDSISYYFKVSTIWRLLQNEIIIDSEKGKDRKTIEYINVETKLRTSHIDVILSCLSYNQINAHTNSVNLLDSKDFTSKKIHNNQNIYKFSVYQYVANLYKNGCEKTIFYKDQDLICFFQQKSINNKKNNNRKRLNFLQYFCDFLFAYLNIEKTSSFYLLQQQVSKITMKQYYILNPIEITCTSVDLDNKILRLFNHKTTPDLPICKAVQMTGSFPIAFKAPKWQKQWGYYHVYHNLKKTVIDLTGHEFTDGGLLANFPIKYFDNEIIRGSYFSHGMQRQNSIVLGFGLDYQKEGSYLQVKTQIHGKYQKNIQNELAFQKILSHFTKWFQIKEGIKLFSKSRWLNFGKQIEKLGSINSKILYEIPILKFLSKILKAYLNADRNLNLEAFPQSIMLQQRDNNNQIRTNQQIRLNAQSSEQKQARKRQEWQWNIRNSYNQFNYFKNILNISDKKQNKQKEPRWTKVYQLFDEAQRNEKQRILCLNNGFMQFKERLNKYQHNDSLIEMVQQKLMSLYLIKMLSLTLKTSYKGSSNSLIKDTLSYRYVYFSFIAQAEEKNGIQLQNISLNHQIKDVKQLLNKQNLKGFIKTYNFKAIQKCLNFWDFKSKYVELLKQNEIKHINNKDKKLKNIEQQLLQSRLHGFQQSKLSDFALIDITQSMRRLIKYLYLQIKLKKIMGKQAVENFFNKEQFDESLKESIVNNYKRTQMLVEYYTQQNDQLIDPKCPNYLTFDEIFDFLCQLKDEGVKIDSKVHYIQYLWSFQQYLSNLQKNQNKYKEKIRFCYDIFISNVEERSIQQISYNLSNISCIQKQEKQLRNFQIVQAILEDKYEQYCDDFLKSSEINQIAIQKLRFTQVVERQLKLILKIDNVDEFASYLFNKVQFRKRESIKVEDQIHIQNLQYQTKQSLKNVIFGQKLQRQKKVNDRMKKSKKKMQQIGKQHLIKQQIFQQSKEIKNSKLEYWLLKYFYFKSIYHFIQNKYSSSTIKQKQQFRMFHNAYAKDMNYLLRFTMALVLLYQDYKSKAKEQKHKYQHLTELLYQLFQQIFQQFMKRYQRLIQLQQNLVTLEVLREIFLVKYVHLSKIIEVVKKTRRVRCKSLSSECIKTFQFISQAITKFDDYKFCLPLFNQDWKQLMKMNHINLYTRFSNLYHNDTQSQKYQKTIIPILENTRNYEVLKNVKSKIKKRSNSVQSKQSSNGLHLIIEEVCDDSAFCAYYHQMLHFKLNQQSGQKDQTKFDIKMVTSKIFGFLLCLGQDIDEIRSDLYKIHNYLFEMFNPQRILQSFKEQGPCVSLNYKSLIQSYKLQLFNAFKVFGQEYQKERGKINFPVKFDQIRMIIEEQQQYYFETCNQILDKAACQIKKIDIGFLPSQKANQIAKTFGYDYICEFNKRHQYSKYNRQCKQTFHKIMNEFYEQFGSMISIILCNLITGIIPLRINQDKIQHFTKGFMIERLMTVYKLKAFIFSKLEKHSFPYDITLKSFYQRCKKKILLNFVVVNLTDKRLQFWNKINSPNMPIWAAIIAASTLPSIHRCFQSERHWDHLQGEQLETKQMLNFFKDKNTLKRKHTLYNSSIYISSIPMELLANNTFFHRFQLFNSKSSSIAQSQLQSLSKLQIIGFAFNKQNQTKNLLHLKRQKNYFNLSLNMIKLIAKLLFSYKQLIVTNKFDKIQNRQHLNRNYEVMYSPLQEIKDLLFNNNVGINTLSTVIQSNDNLILKWYANKLIRLPVKIDTLEFQQVVNRQIYEKYKIKVPSQRAKEAIIRSYEITKTFIHNIQNRFKNNQEKYFKIHTQSDPQRFKVKIKAQITNSTNNYSGYNQTYFKLTFLNHSKWNKNMYNNFVVQYKVRVVGQNQQKFQRCENSEIFWKTQLGGELLVRFYYLHYTKCIGQEYKIKIKQDYISSKNNKVRYSQFIINLQEIFKELPTRNIYQYQFNYAWNEQEEAESRKYYEDNKDISRQTASIMLFLVNLKKVQLKPVKLNGILVSNKQKFPILHIEDSIQPSGLKIIGEKFIQRSFYQLSSSSRL